MRLRRAIGGLAASLLFLCLLVPDFAWSGIPVAGVPAACPAGDQGNACLSGQFTGTGQSNSFSAWGSFNVVVYGSSGPNGNWSATVRLERSFDGGTTWIVAGVGGTGTQAAWNAPNQDVSVVATEPEKGVLYRLNCIAYTSGTILYRFSTTGTSSSGVRPGP